MAQTTIGFGVVLALLGAAGYALTGGVSITALIPTFFGLPLIVMGALALNERFRKHAMHAAAALGLVGFVGSAGGLPKLVTLLTGGEVARPAAVMAQSIMAALTAVFVGLCVKSFIDARRARTGSSRS